MATPEVVGKPMRLATQKRHGIDGDGHHPVQLSCCYGDQRDVMMQCFSAVQLLLTKVINGIRNSCQGILMATASIGSTSGAMITPIIPNPYTGCSDRKLEVPVDLTWGELH